MKILVIGADSFMGGNFYRLARGVGHEVIGTERLPTGAVIQILETKKPSAVINFAAQTDVPTSWHKPWEWYDANVTELARLVHYLSHADWLDRFVHISTEECYGHRTLAATEKNRDNPPNPYAASKAAGDVLVNLYHERYGLPSIIVRPSNVYGPGQQLWKLIAKAIITLKRGDKFTLHDVGILKQYLYVDDASKAILTALERGEPGETYNAGPKHQSRAAFIVRMICNLMKLDFDEVTETIPAPPDKDIEYYIDSTKLRGLGWAPETTIDVGIEKTIAWIEQNWAEIESQQHAA